MYMHFPNWRPRHAQPAVRTRDRVHAHVAVTYGRPNRHMHTPMRRYASFDVAVRFAHAVTVRVPYTVRAPGSAGHISAAAHAYVRDELMHFLYGLRHMHIRMRAGTRGAWSARWTRRPWTWRPRRAPPPPRAAAAVAAGVPRPRRACARTRCASGGTACAGVRADDDVHSVCGHLQIRMCAACTGCRAVTARRRGEAWALPIGGATRARSTSRTCCARAGRWVPPLRTGSSWGGSS